MTEEERSGDEQQRKQRRWRLRLDGVKAEWPVSGGLTLAGSGVVGAVLVVLVWWIFGQPQSQIEVPDMVGMSSVTAEALLRDEGLSLRATYDEVSDWPTGMVLNSHPPAGTKLDRGAGVRLVVAFPHPGTASLSRNGPTVVPPASVPGPNPRSAPAPNPRPALVPNPRPAPAPNPRPAPAPAPNPRPAPNLGKLDQGGTKPDTSKPDLKPDTGGPDTTDESVDYGACSGCGSTPDPYPVVK